MRISNIDFIVHLLKLKKPI